MWFEDALALHRVTTIIFDLYLAIPDIHMAAGNLTEKGLMSTPRPSNVENATVDEQLMQRLDHEGDLVSSRPATTVLLPAANCNYDLPKDFDRTSGIEVFLPPLPQLLDTLIDSVLEAPPLHWQAAQFICFF